MAEPAYVLPGNREEWPAQGEWTWEDYQEKASGYGGCSLCAFNTRLKLTRPGD